MNVDCRSLISEIVERSRSGEGPGPRLESHIRLCDKCGERWEDEQRLSALLGAARDAVAGRRSSEERRREIMNRFAQAPRRSVQPLWNWVLAAAAVLILGVGLAYFWRVVHSGQNSPSRDASNHQAQAAGFDAVAGDDGFVDVAYAPPLASGEFVSVMRTSLQPTALARMGIYVDAAYDGNEILADVMVGEDGMPRAVRLVAEEFEN